MALIIRDPARSRGYCSKEALHTAAGQLGYQTRDLSLVRGDEAEAEESREDNGLELHCDGRCTVSGNDVVVKECTELEV